MKIIIKRSNDVFLFMSAGEVLYKGILARNGLRTLRQLYNNENKLISEIQFRIEFPLKPTNIINLASYQTFTLKYTNIFKPKYICNVINDTYDIIPHKGYYTSIFKNDIQIGYFEDSKISVFGNETIILYLNKLDINSQNLICSFALALKCSFEDNYSTGSLNLGNWGFELKKFDSTWHPTDLF
ncbi:MAG: hypothetical protein L6Q66_00255 [Bacteroidia bacterium]|uniref:hypothetical protein n=1 Tax=Flavobacterium sp. TaxID=239 RepID=UPI0025BE9B53|nr:hypothetical protein [Flavobacterium sp.]MCK6609333.1 hypothetical protein [Flavobacterium sp.]MCK6648062.1 hypothetical protein [Bacteroidia bacterium]